MVVAEQPRHVLRRAGPDLLTAPVARVTATPTSRRAGPDLVAEHGLLAQGHACVVGMDEVGRGALAGPVSVGVVVVDGGTGPVPPGLTDSKLLTPAARAALVPQIESWCVAWAVGHASAAEIDAHGIVAALRLAGRRALAQVVASGAAVSAVLLDGSHNWLSTPPDDLWAAAAVDDGDGGQLDEPEVTTRVKADLACASVAAASVLAKCTRDALMVELDARCGGYDWASNKGYGSASHLAALVSAGPSSWHRRSWRLPGGRATSGDGG